MRRASDERNETAAAAAFLNPSRFIIVANASWRRRPALRNGEKNKIRTGVRGNLAKGRIAANKLVRRGCSAGEQCAVHSSGHSGTKVTVYLRLILHCVGGGI